RVLQVVAEDHGGVIIEPDVRAILPPVFLRDANDHCFHHIAFLHATLRRGGFHRRNHDVTDASVAPERTAQHPDHQQFLSTGVIGYFEAGFILDHDSTSSLPSPATSGSVSGVPTTSCSSGSAPRTSLPVSESTSSTTQRLWRLRGLLSTTRTSAPILMLSLSSCAITFLVVFTTFL